MLQLERRAQVHALWDHLASYDASQSDAALMHLLSTVAGMIGAENAYWFGAVRVTDGEEDPLLGWRPRAMRYLRPLENDERFTRDRLRGIDKGTVDESTVAHARRSGEFRSNRLCDLVSPEWFDGPWYQGYLGRGVHDSLVAAAPVSAMAEGYYGFLRMRPGAPFTEEERDFVLDVLRPLTWFHRQVLLSHGLLVARAPLSPLERRVTALLLTEQPEKHIAAELGISPASLHTYVRDIVKKFGVNGRKGLTALWLGRVSGEHAAIPSE